MHPQTCLNIPQEVSHNPELSSSTASILPWKTASWIMHQSLSIPIKYSFAFRAATFSTTCFALISDPPGAWNIRFTYNSGPYYSFRFFFLCDSTFSTQIWFVATDAATWIIMYTFIAHTHMLFMDLLNCSARLVKKRTAIKP